MTTIIAWSSTITWVDIYLFATMMMASLSVIGYPFVRFVLGKRSLMFAEKATFSILFGVAILVLSEQWASIAGPFFVAVAAIAFLLGILTLLYDIHRHFRGVKLSKAVEATNHVALLEAAIFSAFLGIASFAALRMVVGLSGGTNDDAAMHTLMIASFSTINRVTNFALPWYSFLYYNPDGPHILGTYAVSLLGYPIEKVVPALGAVFNAASLASMWVLARRIFRSRIVAPVIAVTWVGYSTYFWHELSFTFTIEIAAFCVVSAFAYSLWVLDEGRFLSYKTAVSLGLIIALLSSVHPSALVYFGFFLFVLCGWVFMRIVLKRVGGSIRSFAVSLLLLVASASVFSLPEFYNVYLFVNQSLIGIPTDWVIPSARGLGFPAPPLGPNYWVPSGQFYGLVRYLGVQGPFLTLAPLSLILMLLVFLPPILTHTVGQWSGSSPLTGLRVSAVRLAPFCGALVLVLIFMKYFATGTANLSLATLTQPVRLYEMIYLLLIPLALFSVVSFLSACRVMTGALRHYRRGKKVPFGLSQRRIVLESIIVAFLLVSPVAAIGVEVQQFPTSAGSFLTFPPPFYQSAQANLHQFDLMTQDDLSVFQWIRQNTATNATFLVSQLDVGQYLTAVTDRKSIFPAGNPDPLSASSHYRLLSSALEFDPGDPYVISLLSHYHVDYVFVGSKDVNMSVPNWYQFYWQNALFNATALRNSPFLTLATRTGNSWLFKVNTSASFTFQGPQVTSLPLLTALYGNSSLGSWGFCPGVQGTVAENWLTASYNDSFWAAFQLNGPIGFENIARIALEIRSSIPATYRLLIYDHSKDYRSWTFNATTDWSTVILSISTYSSQSILPPVLTDIARIVIASPANMRQNGTAEFGPIFLAKDEVSDSIGESYNGKTGELQQTLTLPGHGSYLVLIPPFFAPSRNATPDPLIRLLPSSDVVVAGDNTDQTVISLRPIGLDLLSLPTVHITRPLREMNLVGTVSEPEPSELIGHDGSPLGGTTIQLDLTRNNFDILNLSDIFVATGELEMGVFVNGSAYSAGANLQIRLFDNYSDAVNSTNAVARFNVASSDRWVILETPLVNQQQLYITIGINGIADVLINPLVYSNNPYY